MNIINNMATEAEITAYLNSVRYSWYYDNYSRLGKLLVKFYSKGSKEKLSDGTCINIMKRFVQNKTSYSSMYDKHYSDILSSLKHMFAHYTPDKQMILSVLNASNKPTNQNRYGDTSPSIYFNNMEIYNAFKVLYDRGVDLKDNDIFTSSLSSNKHIANLLSHYQKPSSTLLETAIKNGCDGVVASMLFQKIPLHDNYVWNAVNANSGETLKVLIDMGAKCSQELFTTACSKSTDPELFTQILRNKEIVISGDHFIQIINRTMTNYDMNERRRYRVNISANKLDSKITAGIIDILIEHGYKITKNDVLLGLSRNAYVNNVDTHIKLDLSIWEACSKNNFYPYDLSNITPSVKILETECGRVSALKTVEQIIKSGTKPNSKCLENACKLKSNVPVVRALISKHKVKITKTCLLNLGKSIGNATLNLLLEFMPDIRYDNENDPKDDNENDPKNESNEDSKSKIKKGSRKKPIKAMLDSDNNEDNDEDNISDINDSDIDDVDDIDIEDVSDIDASDEADEDDSDIDSDELIEYDEYNEEIDGKIDGNSDEEINKILIEQLSNKNSEEDEDLQRAINASMDDLKNQQEQLFINAHKDFSDKTTETAIAQPQPTETAIAQPQPTEKVAKKESKKSSKSTITKSKQKPKKSNKADIYVTKKGQKILIDEDDEENDEGEEDKNNTGNNNDNNDDNNDDDNNNDEKSYSVVGDDTLTNIFTVTKFIQKRQKYKLTPQMVRFWTLDKKLELSFLDIRKKFVSYITTNKLQAKDDKNLIKVDSRMKDILGLEQDKFFNYTNIDHVVMQFYK